ncbi:hypothetical protein V3C99_006400 [Haemonchus contortus]
MGAESSTSAKKPEIVSLTKEQVQRTTETLKKWAQGKDFLNKRQFEEIYAELQPVTDLLFDVAEDGGRCPFSNILLMADGMLGDAASQAATLLRLFGTIAKALEHVVSMYARRNGLSDNDSSALLEYFMHDAPPEARFDRWLLGHSVAAQLVLHVFAPLIFEKGPPLHPSTPCNSPLLSHSAVMVINMHLPSERRKEWTLLFSSAEHGSSFAQLSKRINEEGPCVVVVNSTNGRVFGCFASEGFLMGPNYHGNATSFLFELKPQLRIYSATGLSNDYAYLNVQQVSLPNGLGIGGHETVWPFFIDEDYGKGISMANVSSFEKCHLAGCDQFEISSVEVWRVGEKPQIPIDEDVRRSEKSIIDKDPEAVALLELTGHKMHSEAYRDPAPLLDEPFEI